MFSLKKCLGTGRGKKLRAYYPIVEKINKLEVEIKALSDSELANKTPYFKEK